jgi:YHS domain-containing protein
MRSETRSILGAALGAMLFAGAVVAFAGPQDAAAPAKKDAGKSDVTVVSLGNDKCPTTGKAVKHDKFVEKDGQRVYFCCGQCLGKAKADPAAAITKAYGDAKPVGNKTCPVDGKPIEAGKGKQEVFQGRSIELCSAACEEAYKKDPALMVVKAMYPDAKLHKSDKCIMMVDEAIDPQAVVVYKGEIVRFCCPDCIADFKKDPAGSLAKGGSSQ